MKTAFIHIMKTAGSTVNFAMANNALGHQSYLLLNAGIYRDSDWTDEELREFLTWKNHRTYVHNHATNWSIETIKKYNAQNWLTFSFYRHPGDQWCSFYYWARESKQLNQKKPSADQSLPIVWKYSLDEFLYFAWANEGEKVPDLDAFLDLRRNLDLPKCWPELGYVDIWSNDNFSRFINKYFGKHNLQLTPQNQSTNKGYKHYQAAGLISDQTHQRLVSSSRFKDYQSLLEKPHERGCPADFFRETPPPNHQPKSWKNVPLIKRLNLKKLNPKSTASGFVILANDGAAPRFLLQYINDHPDIQWFGKGFDLFKSTWANQSKWLNNIYLRLPNRDRGIQSIGFVTELKSVANIESFRGFLLEHQIKIIYLSTGDPLRAAIADHCEINGNADSLRNKIIQTESAETTDGIRLTSDEFRQIMANIEQQKSLRDVISTLEQTSQMELDYETLLSNEAVLLNKLWLFLGIGTARTSDELMSYRPVYPQAKILNLEERLKEFPEYESCFKNPRTK
ncbi:MAG: hypothetical protein P8J27_10795 [Mariniblastus sp.]|nr:hypothetical protein [Mariniblastus sp.]